MFRSWTLFRDLPPPFCHSELQSIPRGFSLWLLKLHPVLPIRWTIHPLMRARKRHSNRLFKFCSQLSTPFPASLELTHNIWKIYCLFHADQYLSNFAAIRLRITQFVMYIISEHEAEISVWTLVSLAWRIKFSQFYQYQSILSLTSPDKVTHNPDGLHSSRIGNLKLPLCSVLHSY